VTGAVHDGPTRDEVLAGFAGRRASTTRFAIEARTAQLATEARYATAPAVCERLAEVEEQALLTSFAAGRAGPVQVRIQDLERYASAWAHLVPADVAVRAELACGLAGSHRFRPRDVPRLRAALGVDEEPVRRLLRARGLEEFGVERLAATDRRRWARARLRSRIEDLPPFWTSYALVLTQTVGAGILALPIALGAIGPVPGLALLVVFGLLNVLTITAVAEAFARTGAVRWEGAFFGRTVAGYLGPLAGAALSVVLVVFSVVVLLVYYLGFSTALADATGVSGIVWAAVLFLIGLVLVGYGRMDATVASSLIVGAVNLVVIVALSLVALPFLDPANLAHREVPFVGGAPLDPSVLELAFGAVLLAYFGHTSVANGARTVLRRAPDGRALIRGARAALYTSIAVYGLWVLAIGGAVAPERLARETGTALTPLSEVVGPVVFTIGLVFVVLAMGMASVHFGIGLHAQIRELAGPRFGRRVGSVVGFLPATAVFGVAVLLLASGRGSFAGVLSLLGTTLGPLLAGVFPVLLLASSRRRGDQVPRGSRSWLGHPVVLSGLYLAFLAAVMVHGAVVWTSWWERATALAVTIGTVLLTIAVVRGGAFRPRGVIELRRDGHLGVDRLRLLAGGEHLEVEVALHDRRGRTRPFAVVAGADLPADTVRVQVPLDAFPRGGVHLWGHLVVTGGDSMPLEVSATVVQDGHEAPVVFERGRAEVPGGSGMLTLDLGQASRTRDGGHDGGAER
jgi:amino acid permease